ncbi:ankyrin repeat domain-containing protein [Legionella erythra]|uniref:Ankyrin repeats (3 copies) n=1 Tax=Legionella erythra TaxID=448 RepID=A0A0W0TQ13_LEGER|nr:ankyrin repeat domain-containing protein [Legionella erythra]KTC97715.1 Ankyrin repeats (3 copies) [Legionella erythra]
MKSDEFDNLVSSPEELKAALDANPNLIKEQDEEGMTLLHHTARIGNVMGSTSASRILDVLFASEDLDFTIKDNDGNTPLHTAAWGCNDRVTCQFVFPLFVTEASKRGFDFATLGQHGQTVLHIATKISYTGNFGRHNNVENVIGNAENPGINTLSSSGSSALYYAINHLHFDEAYSLLTAGANPLVYEADRDPFAMLEAHLATLTDMLSQHEYADRHDVINEKISQLNDLKTAMIASEPVKSFAEVRKNARILAQGKRQGSLFATLPDELLNKIAAHTKEPGTPTQEEAEAIAKEHLKRPG